MRYLTRGLLAVSIACVGLLVLLILVDIVGRSLFDQPLRGVVELTELLVALVVFLALARAEELDEHVTVDLLYARLGPLAQKCVSLAAHLLMVPLLFFLTWRMGLHMLNLREVGLTTGVLRIPVYPFVAVGMVGIAIYALVMVARLITRLRSSAQQPSSTYRPPEDEP